MLAQPTLFRDQSPLLATRQHLSLKKGPDL
jgi:hypothetical protein